MSEEGAEHRDISCKVRDQDALFKTALGPLILRGTPLKETYVLEIHYEDSERAHAQTLPFEGFGSQICFDYAEVAHELAFQLCEEKNLVMSNHLNSWPEFQAIVSRKSCA